MHFAVKAILVTIGTISIVLGMIGIVVPLLPTTPLLLLGAACYLKSSDKLYQLLLKNKWLGGYIGDFRDKNGISRKNKILSLGMMWTSITSTIIIMELSFFVISILVIVAVTVSAYILSFDTV